MRHRSKLLLAGLCATFLLAAAVSSASANHLRVNEQGHRIVWSALEFNASAGSNITCAITLEGSFHSRTIAKVANALIGHVNRASVGACAGGSATMHTETLPWHEQYNSFTGTLPSITTVKLALVGARWRFRNSVETCEAGTTQAEPGFGTIELGARGEATGLRAEGTINLRGGFLCGFATGTFAGRGSVRTAGGGTIVVTLIEEEVEPTPARLTPSPVEFGRVEPEELARRTVTITAGTNTITINRISIVRGNYFAITDPNRCVGARLSERGTCAFKVLFAAPGRAGEEVSDTVRVETTERTLEDTIRGST